MWKKSRRSPRSTCFWCTGARLHLDGLRSRHMRARPAWIHNRGWKLQLWLVEIRDVIRSICRIYASSPRWGRSEVRFDQIWWVRTNRTRGLTPANKVYVTGFRLARWGRRWLFLTEIHRWKLFLRCNSIHSWRGQMRREGHWVPKFTEWVRVNISAA